MIVAPPPTIQTIEVPSEWMQDEFKIFGRPMGNPAWAVTKQLHGFPLATQSWDVGGFEGIDSVSFFQLINPFDGSVWRTLPWRSNGTVVLMADDVLAVEYHFTIGTKR